MKNLKNKNTLSIGRGWAVRCEGSYKIMGLFEKENDALDIAIVAALNEEGFVIVNEKSGQFDGFNYEKEIYVKKYGFPLIPSPIEITHSLG